MTPTPLDYGIGAIIANPTAAPSDMRITVRINRAVIDMTPNQAYKLATIYLPGVINDFRALTGLSAAVPTDTTDTTATPEPSDGWHDPHDP